MPRDDLKFLPRLLRTKPSAFYLSISVKALRKLVLLGKIRVVQMRAGTNSPYLFDRLDLDRWIEQNKS